MTFKMLMAMTGDRFTMLNNVGNFISSFGSNSRKNVYSVLKDSRLEKEELSRMINKVTSLPNGIQVGHLSFFMSEISSIPKDIKIEGDLHIYLCENRHILYLL